MTSTHNSAGKMCVAWDSSSTTFVSSTTVWRASRITMRLPDQKRTTAAQAPHFSDRIVDLHDGPPARPVLPGWNKLGEGIVPAG